MLYLNVELIENKPRLFQIRKKTCIAYTSDKDILNLQICEYLFIKSHFNFMCTLMKQSVYVNDNQKNNYIFVLKLGV